MDLFPVQAFKPEMSSNFICFFGHVCSNALSKPAFHSPMVPWCRGVRWVKMGYTLYRSAGCLLFSCSLLLCNYIIRLETICHTILVIPWENIPRLNNRLLKPQDHTCFTFFSLNPLRGQAMLEDSSMPNFLLKNWNRFGIIREERTLKYAHCWSDIYTSLHAVCQQTSFFHSLKGSLNL